MKFKIGKGEFGEIYHTACAYQLDSCVTVEFDDFARGQEFFDTFIVRERRQGQGEHVQHPGESANVIRDRYHAGCMKSVCEAIQEKSRKDSWKHPLAIKTLLTSDPKVLLWHRNKSYQSHRNSSFALIRQLAGLCRDHTTEPVLVAESAVPDSNCYELVSYWENEFFNEHSIAKQLWCLDALFRHGGTLSSLGVMSGAMDGPALFFGHKTIFLARHADATPRTQKVYAAVPNLIWQQVEYSGTLLVLKDADLSAIERKIWC